MLYPRRSLSIVRKVGSVSLAIILRKLIGLLPREESRWVFGDGVGGRERRGGNSKYLFLQLAELDENDDLTPVWISRNADEVETLKSNGYTAYHSRSVSGLYSFLRAKKIFCTNGMDFTWYLTGGADIVQLWHGTPIKEAGLDFVRNRLSGSGAGLYRKHVVWNWDYLITTSRNPPADVLRRAFGMDKEKTLVTGFPRTDAFYKDLESVDIGIDTDTLDHLETLSEDATVFLYAPTWRRNYREQNTNPLRESGLNLDRLNHVLKDADSYLVIKLHPAPATDVSDEISDLDRVLLADPEADAAPFLKRVDSLITDYSSTFIDFLLLDRPIIFFPYDLDRYEKNEGLYYDYDSVTPGFSVMDAELLLGTIKRIANGEDPHETEREVICRMFHRYQDGQSAKRIHEHLTCQR